MLPTAATGTDHPLVRDTGTLLADAGEVLDWIADFSPVLAAAAAAMVLISVRGEILFPNAAYCELLGRTGAELDHLALPAILHPDEIGPNIEEMRALLEGRVPELRRQRRYLRPDGSVLVGLLSTRVVRTDRGGALGFFSQLEDVTARHDAETALARSEEMFRQAMESSAMGMALLDPAGHWLRVNPALCRITGRSEDELLGMTFQEMTHPDDLGTDLDLLRRMLAGEIDSYRLDKRYLRPDGSSVWIRLTATVARRPDGTVARQVVQVEDLTEERRAARELAAQDERFRLLADGATDVVVVRARTVPELRIEYLSRSAEALVGRPLTDLYTDPDQMFELIHPDDVAGVRELLADPGRSGGAPFPLRVLTAAGDVLSLMLRTVPIHDDEGNVVGAEGLAWDVTARRQAEEALMARERQFRALVEHAADAVALRDSGGIVRYVSPAIADITGYPAEELVGARVGLRMPADQQAALQAAIDDAATAPGVVGRAEVRTVHRDGTDRWVEIAVTNRLEDPDVRGQILNLRDVTARHAAEQTLAHRAAYDTLTGLPNRATVQRHLALALAANPAEVGVLFVDLSGLKPVNDTLGHVRGDAVLGTVARRLARVVGTAGLAGRFGGDEFAVVTRGARPAALLALADRIVRELGRPITAPDGGQVYLSASVGVAVGQPDSTVGTLLANADLAMYDVKRRAGRGVRLFDTALAERATARLALERDLRSTDLDRDLRDHYQLVVDLGTGRVAGAEALLRWQHPSHGLLAPAEFIPVAEETGMIDDLGLWVLSAACRQQVAWAERDVSVAVNLSPLQLYEPDLADRVAELLTRTGARPDRLGLEVTESALIEERVAGPALRALKDLGVQLALDDFGTGYSSLTALRRYPFDTVKIDRSFVGEITRSEPDLAIVRHVIDLAHDLDMRVVAEGVETEHQLRLLGAAGADTAQGYFLGRPAPAGEALDLREPAARAWS